jgi:hypothetical protein
MGLARVANDYMNIVISASQSQNRDQNHEREERIDVAYLDPDEGLVYKDNNKRQRR